MTLVVIGVLTGMAIPRLNGAVARARATAILSDARVVQLAALDYFVDHDAWPPAAAPGEVPSGLRSFLPDGFTFERGTASLAYGPAAANAEESEDDPGMTIHIANDPALRDALARLLGQDGSQADPRWSASWIVIADGQGTAGTPKTPH